MNIYRFNKASLLLVGLSASVVLTSSLRAEEIRTQSPSKLSASTSKPNYLSKYQIATQASTSLISVYNSGAINPALSNCAEIAAIAIHEGRNPGTPCDQPSSSYTGITNPPGETYTAPEQNDVLLIHGFSFTENHDCQDHWATQKNAIEEASDNQRKATIISWYHGNKHCEPKEDELDGRLSQASSTTKQTPISNVSDDLRDWIFTNYTQYGRSIDIVAHSLGGIVTRKMLHDYGQELMVSNVITLGTPHGGVQAFVLNGTCAAIKQCLESSAGSEFMNALAHNPQSTVPTKWTLIAAANDQVVGNGTGLQMNNGSNGGPSVSKFEYQRNHRFGCAFWSLPIGHQSLTGEIASETLNICNTWNQSIGTVDNPTTRVLNALGLN